MTSPLLRPNYFEGQTLTAQGLNDNLALEWERRWAHNRVLHGAGIGQGFTVTFQVGEVELGVEPGYGIDPEGRELVLTEPQTLQVPPVPGPSDYVLICRYDPDPEGFGATGACSASGVSAWVEEPVVELVTLEEYPGVADACLALASVEVTACVLSAINFGRRRELGAQRLPYVDGGVFRPSWSDWEVVQSDSDPFPRYGFRVEVPTVGAAFSATPDYQARLSGRRWLTIDEGKGPNNIMLWTVDANVIDQSSAAVTVEILIPSVQVSVEGVMSSISFERFLARFYGTSDEFKVIAADELGWAITWIGVEGSL